MKCKYCNLEVADGYMFCPNCGAPVKYSSLLQCPQCGTEVSGDIKFCPICGSKMLEQRNCIACGSPLITGTQFCPQCGANQLTALDPAGVGTHGNTVQEDVAMQETEPSAQETIQLTEKKAGPINQPQTNAEQPLAATEETDEREVEEKHSSKKVWIIAFSVFLVLGATGFFLFTNNSSSHTTESLDNTVYKKANSEVLCSIDDVVAFYSLMKTCISDYTERVKKQYEIIKPSIEEIARRNNLEIYVYHYVNGNLGDGELSSYECYLYKNCKLTISDTGYPTFSPADDGVSYVIGSSGIMVYKKDLYDELLKMLIAKCGNKLYMYSSEDSFDYYTDGSYFYVASAITTNNQSYYNIHIMDYDREIVNASTYDIPQTGKSKTLTYETFLDIYQSLAEELKNSQDTPSEAFLSKYGLGMKGEMGSFHWTFGKGFDYDTDDYNVVATEAHAWWITYYVGEEYSLDLTFADNDDYQQFKTGAEEYGLGRAIVRIDVGGDNDEGIARELFLAVKESLPNDVKFIHTKNEAKQLKAIGSISFDDASRSASLNPFAVSYLPNKYLSDLSSNDDDANSENALTLQMEGYIGDYRIIMLLNIRGSKAEGNYHYDNYSSKLYLNGDYSNGKLVLHETTDEGRPTGMFDGVLSGNEFSGEFINYKGEKFAFILQKK